MSSSGEEAQAAQELAELNAGELGHADGPITPEEAKQLEELADLLKDDIAAAPSKDFPEITGRWAQLRFLRGHNWNVEEAAQWFRDGLEWRKKHNVDELNARLKQTLEAQLLKLGRGVQANSNSAPAPAICREGAAAMTGVSGGDPLYTHAFLPHADKVLLHYPERYFHKADRRGNPVMITAQPFINDVDGLLRAITAEQYLEYQIARSEWQAILLHRLSEEQQRLVQISFIWDLKDLSFKYWKKISSKEFKAFGGLYTGADFYPEIAARILALNMPWFLNLAFKAIRPMLNPRTLAKVRVWGANYTKSLSEEVDLECIPLTMQGKCECPDGCFPNNWKTINISRGSAEEVVMTLERRTLVTYEFQCKGHSLGFQIDLKEAGSDAANTVVPYDKHESEKITRGECMCPAGSTVKLVFDNKFSWMRGKTVLYNITTIAQDEESERQQQQAEVFSEGLGADLLEGSALVSQADLAATAAEAAEE